tara:strand:+ start:788 stop:1366 length:579 start_codon:yes stop_codon:yes gene_type:complete
MAHLNTIIETERLIIRVPTLADLDAVQNAKEANWHELQKWMVWASDEQKPISALKHYIEVISAEDHAKGGLHLFAFHKNTGDFVMASGLIPEGEPHFYGTGYWGNINYLGQGYATEMMRAILHYAFTKHKAVKINIAYYEGNEKSRRVIDKCGFTFVQTLPKIHQSFATGEWLDEHQFGLTAETWKKQHDTI